jgi:hypothetical protein
MLAQGADQGGREADDPGLGRLGALHRSVVVQSPLDQERALLEVEIVEAQGDRDRALVLNMQSSFAADIFAAPASAFAIGENVDIFFAGT